MKKFILMLALLGMTSCASVKDTLLTTTHTGLLYHEFEAEALAVMDLPLQPDAKNTIDRVISELDSIRLELGKLHEQNAGRLALTVAQSHIYLERIKQLYLEGREIVVDYYESAGIQPSQSLINYDRSAVFVYVAVSNELENAQGRVDISGITDFLTMVFRVYGAAHGLPSV